MAQVSTLRKWPIGAAVNKYKKDMAKNFTEPKSLQNGTTGMSTGAKSSIPPSTGPTKLMKFPSMNMTNK